MSALPTVSVDQGQNRVIDTDGITIPRALLWAILTAAVATTLAIIAVALDMSPAMVIISTGLAVVAGCSILAAVVILCCRGAINQLRQEQWQMHDQATRQVVEVADHFDTRINDLVTKVDRTFKKVRGDALDAVDRTRIAVVREVAEVREVQETLLALSTTPQQQRRRLNCVD